MKIAFFGKTAPDRQDYFLNSLSAHQVTFSDQDLSEDNMPTDTSAEIISIFVQSKVTAKVIDSFPNLKMIAVRATGFDSVDIKYAKEKNIIVCNVPTYGSHTVAEFAFGLMLSLTRKIPQAITKIKSAAKFDHEGLQGFDLFGKTLGVVGTGKIGANVIKIAKGFGMEIMATDTFPNEDLARTLDFKYVLLEQLLKESDLVSIHTPLTPETTHLINESNISLMKDSAVLINTARGKIIETSALVSWLQENPNHLAAVDVLEDETEITADEQTLLNLPNAIVTPHTAFNTKEAEDAIAKTTTENILNFAGGKPSNVI